MADVTLEYDDHIPIDGKKFQKWKKSLLQVCNKLLGSNLTQSANRKILLDLQQSLDSDWESWGEIYEVIKDKNKLLKAGIPENLLNVQMEEFMNFKAFNNTYQPKQTDLAKALKKGLEVYVHGAYYALRASKYGRFVQQYWGVDVDW